jgi:two-component system response regulator YesN
MKVFLVDDEVGMLNGIKKSVPWEREGLEVVGDALNGQQAYPLIKQKKPDILITDIHMPLMDGLCLSRLVKNELPQTKILALSDLHEFQYIQSAISIGITDFLAKPVNSAELLDAVRNAAGDVEREKKERQKLESFRKNTEENRAVRRYKLIHAAISGRMRRAELLREGEKLGIDFSGTEYAVLLFKTMSRLYNAECRRAAEEAADRIRKSTEALGNILSIDRGGDGWVFIAKGNKDIRADEVLAQCSKTLIQSLGSNPSVEFFGGIGRTVTSVEDIPYSYQDADKAFAGRYFQELNQIVPLVEEEGCDTHLLILSDESRRSLDNFMNKGLCEETDDFIERYFGFLGKDKCKSRLLSQYITLDIFFRVKAFLDKIGLGIDCLSMEARDINTAAGENNSLRMAKAYLKKLLREVVDLRDEQSGKKYGFSVRSSLEFIEENYYRNDLSLNMIAAHLKLSPGYFSSLFHEKVGKTFVEYLTYVRMENAKKLLRTTNKKLSIIGYEVGYQDNHYFSYLFKKTEGCTPTEYRKRNRT